MYEVCWIYEGEEVKKQLRYMVGTSPQAGSENNMSGSENNTVTLPNRDRYLPKSVKLFCRLGSVENTLNTFNIYTKILITIGENNINLKVNDRVE